MKVLIIIPAYNESENILNTVRDLTTHCPEFDYIVINDGSTDDTDNVLKSNNINHICNERNFGIGATVQRGYQYALCNNYDIAIQFDGDGQHKAEYLHKLIGPIENNSADVAIGSRFIEKTDNFKSTFMRGIGIKLLSFIIYLRCNKRVYDVTSGMRAANKKAIKFYSEHYAKDYPEPQAILEGLLNGLRVIEIHVIMSERMHGKSSITPLKAISYMCKVGLRLIKL